MANQITSFDTGIFFIFFVANTVYAQNVNCTATGAGRFADTTDTTCQNYTYCIYIATNNSYVSYDYACPSTSVFNPAISQCTAPTNYVCNVTSSVCTVEGFVADSSVTDCSSYIECVLINGSYVSTTYTCPTTTFYNPNTTLCEPTYTCPTSTAFTCTAAGRFANSDDTTCQTYYLCALAVNGTFVSYEYTCPSTSVFSPTTRLCTTSYTCPTAG